LIFERDLADDSVGFANIIRRPLGREAVVVLCMESSGFGAQGDCCYSVVPHDAASVGNTDPDGHPQG
jgi:hypothetical protein